MSTTPPLLVTLIAKSTLLIGLTALLLAGTWCIISTCITALWLTEHSPKTPWPSPSPTVPKIKPTLLAFLSLKTPHPAALAPFRNKTQTRQAFQAYRRVQALLYITTITTSILALLLSLVP